MKPWMIKNFWKKVKRGDPADCWPWSGYSKQSGHGLTWHFGHPIHASRKAWLPTHGEITDDLCVLHKCNNAICCNPHHMYLGTRGDNARDRWEESAKRRTPGKPSSLTDEEKFQVRKMREAGMTIRECRSYFGVSQTTIMAALRLMRERLGPEKLPNAQSARPMLRKWQDVSSSSSKP